MCVSASVCVCVWGRQWVPFSVGVCVCVFEYLHPCVPVAALMSGSFMCVHTCARLWWAMANRSRRTLHACCWLPVRLGEAVSRGHSKLHINLLEVILPPSPSPLLPDCTRISSNCIFFSFSFQDHIYTVNKSFDLLLCIYIFFASVFLVSLSVMFLM